MADDQQYRVCHESDQDFLDGIVGTISACANLSAKLGVLKETTAVCMRNPLDLLAQDFLSLKQSYHMVNGLLDRQKPIWSPAATTLIHNTQLCCQEITTQLSEIIDDSTEWHILAPEGTLRSLKKLSASFAVQKSRLGLLIAILGLVQHMSDKPDQHESPDSIIIPDPQPVHAYYAHQDPEVRAATERRDAALYAARNMEDWSKYLEQSFASVREILQAKISSVDTASESSHDEESVATSERSANMENWSSTQSTTGIMTPTEDWSDLGSETTETGRAPAITRHSLQICGYFTASFLRLVEEAEGSVRRIYEPELASNDLLDMVSIRRLHKAFGELAVHLLHALDAPLPSDDLLSMPPATRFGVTRGDLHQCMAELNSFSERNIIIEQSFGPLPGSTPVGTADIESMHRAYQHLFLALLHRLGTPVLFQNRSVSAPVPAPVSVSEVSKPVVSEEQNKKVDIDQALESIINSMWTTPNDEDIMKLVFHWTILDDCNGFKCADVMKLN
ncbi:hypothetical protein KCU95_g15506, partial [Aureobasidium melanogenum]